VCRGCIGCCRQPKGRRECKPLSSRRTRGDASWRGCQSCDGLAECHRRVRERTLSDADSVSVVLGRWGCKTKAEDSHQRMIRRWFPRCCVPFDLQLKLEPSLDLEDIRRVVYVKIVSRGTPRSFDETRNERVMSRGKQESSRSGGGNDRLARAE
jgi:hypothetical protein